MNRQWLLAKRPQGAVDRACFKYQESADLAGRGMPGQLLIQWELLLCAPTIRNWITGNRSSYHPTVDIGEPIMAPALGRILESNHPDYKVGQRISGIGSWQDQQWIHPAAGIQLIPEGVSSVDAMGVYGLNAVTAYCGLARYGVPKEGEALVVSGAAGSVGSVVAQIGRIMGCRVVGIAGGTEKLRWLREDCGINGVIDYKSEDVARRVDQLLPDGIDIYFDNVGGEMLEIAAARMRPLGRILLCGQIASYDSGEAIVAPPLDMMRLIYGEISLHGFLVTRQADLFPKALSDLQMWNAQGLLVHREDVRAGMGELPETYSALFTGTNVGTLLARISDGNGGLL